MARNYDTRLMPEGWTDVEAPTARYTERGGEDN